jgi:hypothetical protein
MRKIWIAFLIMVPCLFAQGGDKKCQEVGGAILTNYIPEAGTITIFNGKPPGRQVNFKSIALGTATGDLRGGVVIYVIDPGPPIIHVQGNWVTEAGDTIYTDEAFATPGVQIPGSAISAAIYPTGLNIIGGTGRFAGASGHLKLLFGAATVVTAYLQLNKAVVTAVDQGNGVNLTLPWVAIWFDQWWIIVPTPVPPPVVIPTSFVLVTARRSNGVLFLPNELWTADPYFGTKGTYFADVTGDGKADAIAVSDKTVTVRRSSGHDFGPHEDWTHGPYFGTKGIYFADVTGDGKADAIVVNDDTVTVRRSSGHDFGPNEDWTHGPYFGSRGIYFADVTGDGKADAIVVNNDMVTVRRSSGHDFGPNEDWTHGPYFGSLGTYFADVDGDGKADAIVVNADTVTVRRSTGNDFLV